MKCSSKSPRSSSRSVWLYAHADWDNAQEMIEEFDWNDIMSDDIIDSWTRWHSLFMSIMQECVPRKVLPSRRNLPWLNKNIKSSSAMRKRNTLFKKTGYSAKYRSARNRVIGLIRRAKTNYFEIWIPGTQRSFGKQLSFLISNSLQSLCFCKEIKLQLVMLKKLNY